MRLKDKIFSLIRGTRDRSLIRLNVEIIVRDSNGNLLDRFLHHNLVTLVGRNLLRDKLRNVGSDYITHMAVGTSSVAPSSGDTQLGAEVARVGVGLVTVDDGRIDFRTFLDAGTANGNTLQEAGLLTQPTGGVLFARVTTNPIVKTSSVTVTYNWSVLINSGT